MKHVVEAKLCDLLVEHHYGRVDRQGMIDQLAAIGCGVDFATEMVDAQIGNDDE